jgi:hypothetical protein
MANQASYHVCRANTIWSISNNSETNTNGHRDQDVLLRLTGGEQHWLAGGIQFLTCMRLWKTTRRT